MTQKSKHVFNDDLLLSEVDRQRASEVFPSVFHILDNEPLREVFQKYEAPANREKKVSRRRGYVFIGLASLALLTSLIQAALPNLSGFADRIVSLFAVLMFCLSVVFTWFVWRGWRRSWLANRMMTERLRQLQFQMFPYQLSALVESIGKDEGTSNFSSLRLAWLRRFQNEYENKISAKLERLTDILVTNEAWLIARADKLPGDDVLVTHAELFDAYEQLRFEHQINYAAYKLSGAPGMKSEAGKVSVFSSASMIMVAILLFVSALIIPGVMLLTNGEVSPFLVSGLQIIAGIMTVGIIAVRSLEEGLQPSRELERLIQYKRTMEALRSDYSAASTVSEKVAIMRAAEEEVVEEMKNFLYLHKNARFRF